MKETTKRSLDEAKRESWKDELQKQEAAKKERDREIKLKEIV